jgi:hypothetical protein
MSERAYKRIDGARRAIISRADQRKKQYHRRIPGTHSTNQQSRRLPDKIMVDQSKSRTRRRLAAVI